MTARTGLNDLILQLRGMVNAGTADYAIGTANYWDGDHLQEVLDRHRQEVYHEQLTLVPKYTAGGSVNYFDYQSSFRNFEQTTGGTAVFVVEDSTGADSGTANWSADYARGLISFTSNQAGTVYYLTGRSYNLNGAAADIWRMKAAAVADQFDFSTDNHSMSRSQRIKNYLNMAAMYEAKAGLTGENVITLYRSDVAV